MGAWLHNLTTLVNHPEGKEGGSGIWTLVRLAMLEKNFFSHTTSQRELVLSYHEGPREQVQFSGS